MGLVKAVSWLIANPGSIPGTMYDSESSAKSGPLADLGVKPWVQQSVTHLHLSPQIR